LFVIAAPIRLDEFEAIQRRTGTPPYGIESADDLVNVQSNCFNHADFSDCTENAEDAQFVPPVGNTLGQVVFFTNDADPAYSNPRSMPP